MFLHHVYAPLQQSADSGETKEKSKKQEQRAL